MEDVVAVDGEGEERAGVGAEELDEDVDGDTPCWETAEDGEHDC